MDTSIVKPAVEVKNPEACNKVEYVMDNILTAVGFPFRFVEDWKRPAYRIKCKGENSDNVDLWCPNYDYEDSLDLQLKKTRINGLPILFKKTRPSRLRNQNRLNFDAINIPYKLLTRQEEEKWFKTSKSPQFPAYRSELYELGILNEPIIDGYINKFTEWIADTVKNRYPKLSRRPLWENGKEFAVILSHDVDCIRPISSRLASRYLYEALDDTDKRARERFEYLLLALEQSYRLLFNYCKPNILSNNITQWIDLEREYGFRSTFYVAALNDRCRRDPTYYIDDRVNFKGRNISIGELFRTLSNAGWEIGLHGSLKSFNSKPLLQSEKQRLEKAIGTRVDGIRQHCLYLETPITWHKQQLAHFKYDSTLGYNERLGYRAGISFPYRIPSRNVVDDHELFEIPMSIHDNVLFYHESTSKEFTIKRVLRRLDAVRQFSGVANLLWHPRCLRNFKWPIPIEVYEEILKYLDTVSAYVVTASDLHQHWVKRRKEIKL